MTKKKARYIEPLYLYKKGKPDKVFLTIEDYQALMKKLKLESKKVKAIIDRRKKEKAAGKEFVPKIIECSPKRSAKTKGK